MAKLKKSNPDLFTLKKIPEQDDLKTTTKHFLSQSTIGASSIKTMNFNGALPNKDISLQFAKEILEDSFKRLESGDLSTLEQMLLSQALALNMAFNSLAVRSTRQQDVSTMQMLVNLCFKAQNQSRATIDSLVRLKCPSSTQFIKQANIAQGHQQVNNLAEKNITAQNELLKADYAKLDSGGATTAKRIDTTLEALATIHRR
jgi:hypothetical protein